MVEDSRQHCEDVFIQVICIYMRGYCYVPEGSPFLNMDYQGIVGLRVLVAGVQAIDE